MGSRLKLHEELCNILGTKNVYFDPPASVKMNHPCIRYSLGAPDVRKANNRIYKNVNRYKVIVIDYDPESEIPDTIINHFEMASITARYVADNLNHTVIDLYY